MPSQYATDFDKCIERIQLFSEHKGDGGHVPGTRSLSIAAVGGLGGRVDQGFAIINQLYSMVEDDASSVMLYSDRSISFVLKSGCHSISTPLAEGYLTENVGIIPIGRPAVISTTGLEWDIKNWPTEFGKQVSTSNHIKSDTIEVKTDASVLFTVELPAKPPPCRCSSC